MPSKQKLRRHEPGPTRKTIAPIRSLIPRSVRWISGNWAICRSTRGASVRAAEFSTSLQPAVETSLGPQIVGAITSRHMSETLALFAQWLRVAASLLEVRTQDGFQS
jgi:hypothetical protein